MMYHFYLSQQMRQLFYLVLRNLICLYIDFEHYYNKEHYAHYST